MFTQTVFNDVIDFINEKLPHHINMKALEDKSGYSKRQLSRIFLKNIGLTPVDYIELLSIYRFLLELKFTHISIKDLCLKYSIKNARNFQAKIAKKIGVDVFNVNDFKMINKLDFHLLSTNINLPKRYLKCELTSLFNYHLPGKGVRYKTLRPLGSMFTSHYHQKESIIDLFCKNHLINRNELWCCSKFTPFSAKEYEFEFFVCAQNNLNIQFPEEDISLQGDYLMFTWIGNREDTYSRVSNIYDNFFLKYGLTRKNGWDLERRIQLADVKGYYIYSYYIPVELSIAILDIVDAYSKHTVKDVW